MKSKAQSSKMKDSTYLALGALGVVYGDIGTSPLYALKECFYGTHGMPLVYENILGILSLFLWSIILVVCVKYLAVLMKADNNGEGGIMALLALLSPKSGKLRGAKKKAMLLGLFGAALLYGDGMITPAISVLSAVEGLEVATPLFQKIIVPITCIILVGLFWAQKRGTHRIGAVFGPLMLIWFLVIGLIGVPWVFRHPEVLLAFNPYLGIKFFINNGVHGFLVLSAVVLCITGAEALYADMGHFGAGPIRSAWYWIVLPALIFNYLGQGALLLDRGVDVIKNPFYFMVPRAFLLPLVALATAATVIASQALISGAYSLTQQAMQLGYLPRFAIVHTSESQEGQIFIPKINEFLLIACIALVLWFQDSSALAGAYGIAVVGTMTATSILLFGVAREVWKISLWKSVGMVGFFLIIDLSYMAANIFKVFHGGWVPIVIAVSIFAIMVTWQRGRRILSKETFSKSLSLEKFQAMVEKDRPHRVKGTAIFMTTNLDIAPRVLLHHYKHNQVLHDKVILLTIITEHVPSVPIEEHARVTELGNGIFQVASYYGFMQRPDVFEILDCCEGAGLKTDRDRLSFFLGRETLLTTGRSSMRKWRKRLFVFLSRNAQPATAFFGIPADRVIEVGLQLEV